MLGITIDSIRLAEIIVNNYQEIGQSRYGIYLELSSNKLIFREISEINSDPVGTL